MKKKKFRVTFNAPVVLCLVALCFIATLVNLIVLNITGNLFFVTYHSSLLSPLTWIMLISHIFGHASWNHLIGNMCYLLLLGPMLEEKYGSQTIAIVAAVVALATSLINYIFFPSSALCGASGVVFAFILLSSFTGFKEGEIPLTFILVALFFIGQQIFEGITIKDNISNMSHIVGGIIGGFLGYGLNIKTRFEK